jgi:hypothetical protein
MGTITQPTEQRRSIDVTGLPEETVRAVELLISQLRGQQQPPAQQQPGIGLCSSYTEWSKALREWVDSHPRRETLADDSREAIYADDRDK